MSLYESIVEEAALILPAATLIPAFCHWEKEKSEAIRRLTPAIPQSRTLATLRDTLVPKLLSGELRPSTINPEKELICQTIYLH